MHHILFIYRKWRLIQSMSSDHQVIQSFIKRILTLVKAIFTRLFVPQLVVILLQICNGIEKRKRYKNKNKSISSKLVLRNWNDEMRILIFQIDSVIEKEGNTAKAELSLVANSSDNGVTYRCEAKNKALSTAYSESVTFHVLCKCL